MLKLKLNGTGNTSLVLFLFYLFSSKHPLKCAHGSFDRNIWPPGQVMITIRLALYVYSVLRVMKYNSLIYK